jgi:hypothetical protein
MSETPDEKRTRRRWINLAELVAVAGLLIGALTLWLNWSDRREEKAQAAAASQAAVRDKAEERRRIGLVATKAEGDEVTFKGVACALQTADITFPTALGAETRNTVLEHRIEADWFKKPLLKVADAAGQKSGRLPVLISSQCVSEDGERLETAIYDLPYRVSDGGLFGGKSVELQGLILRERTSEARGQARLDAIWRQTAPRPKGK